MVSQTRGTVPHNIVADGTGPRICLMRSEALGDAEEVGAGGLLVARGRGRGRPPGYPTTGLMAVVSILVSMLADLHQKEIRRWAVVLPVNTSQFLMSGGPR